MAESAVTVTCLVPVPVERAYALFVEHIDRWWVRDRAPEAIIRFEGDQLVEATSEGAKVLATISAIEEPARIELAWEGPHAQPGDTVEIRFEPEATATRVTVSHLRPALQPNDVAVAVLGLWWGDLLSRLVGGATYSSTWGS
jgi:uncharacterized protein YndB with AHSA1/START domain